MVSRNNQTLKLRFGVVLAFTVAILASKAICTTTVEYTRIQSQGGDTIMLSDASGDSQIVLRQLPELQTPEQCQENSETFPYVFVDESGKRYHAALDLLNSLGDRNNKRLSVHMCPSVIDNYLPFKVETSTDGNGKKFFKLKLGHFNFSSFFESLLGYPNQIRTQQALNEYLDEQKFILVPWGQQSESSSQQLILAYFTVEVLGEMTMNVATKTADEVKFEGNGFRLSVYVPSDPNPSGGNSEGEDGTSGKGSEFKPSGGNSKGEDGTSGKGSEFQPSGGNSEGEDGASGKGSEFKPSGGNSEGEDGTSDKGSKLIGLIVGGVVFVVIVIIVIVVCCMLNQKKPKGPNSVDRNNYIADIPE